MARRPDLRVTRFADVQLVALALADEQCGREFVTRTLRKLADAEGELRDTLCVYIGEQFSAARAARALYARDGERDQQQGRLPAIGDRRRRHPADAIPPRWPATLPRARKGTT